MNLNVTFIPVDSSNFVNPHALQAIMKDYFENEQDTFFYAELYNFWLTPFVTEVHPLDHFNAFLLRYLGVKEERTRRVGEYATVKAYLDSV